MDRYKRASTGQQATESAAPSRSWTVAPHQSSRPPVARAWAEQPLFDRPTPVLPPRLPAKPNWAKTLAMSIAVVVLAAAVPIGLLIARTAGSQIALGTTVLVVLILLATVAPFVLLAHLVRSLLHKIASR